MNANSIINDNMTLEEKLAAIESAVQQAQSDAIAKNGGNMDAPFDPASLTICDGCEQSMSHEIPSTEETLTHSEWSNEALLERISWGEAALNEISESMKDSLGLTIESEAELMAEYNGIYEEMQQYAQEAESRRLAHDFNKEMEAA